MKIPSLLLSSLLLAIVPASAAPSPTYALSGIVQGVPASNPPSHPKLVPLADAVAATRLLYTTDTPNLRATLKARNDAGLKSPPVIVYMGGFTTNNDDVPTLERNHRTGIAMTPVARLATDLDANATEFVVSDLLGDELAIKASTANISDAKDSGKFCFWLRLDDELLKVTKVDAESRRIRVERGFAGTRPATHRSGSAVLTPVYLGNRKQLDHARHTNSWPGGPDYLRYAVDPRQPAAATFKAALVIRMMEAGYDGAWFDTFQPRPYNLCDALGRPVAYFWDFKEGRIYTIDTYLDAIKDYVRNIRRIVLAKMGRQPVLYANSASASYRLGVKSLFNSATQSDLLDGYCFEDSYLRVVATRAKGKGIASRAGFTPITGERWVTNLTNHADAANSGLSGICMAGPAGYLAAFLNSTLPDYDQLLRFSYGSYLLTVTSARTTSFGLPLLETDGRAIAWPSMLFAPLGDPMQSNSIGALKVQGSPCYSREFEHGLVIVNPSDAEARSVPIPVGFVDATTRKQVTSITLRSADAAILMRAKR